MLRRSRLALAMAALLGTAVGEARAQYYPGYGAYGWGGWGGRAPPGGRHGAGRRVFQIGRGVPQLRTALLPPQQTPTLPLGGPSLSPCPSRRPTAANPSAWPAASSATAPRAT